MSKDFNPENHLLLVSRFLEQFKAGQLTYLTVKEQGLLKLPYQLMRQNFKSSQKLIERDVAFIKNAASEAQLMAENDQASSADSVRQIDVMIDRLQTLKRKIGELKHREDSLVRKSKARVAHLQELYTIDGLESEHYDSWNKTRLQRLLVDDMLRQGFLDSAHLIVKSNPDLEPLVDFEVLQKCKLIEQSLREGHTELGLTWCQENKSTMKKVSSHLEFEIRLQQYIQHVREGRMLDAISYYRKYLVPMTDNHADQVLKAAGLLAFPPTPELDNPYKDLFSLSRWNYLADLFVTTYYSMYGLTKPSLLQITLSAGLSALKTPSCKTGDQSVKIFAGYKVPLCPICSPELGELAKPLPYAHHVRSFVAPDPVMLPNGRIFGKEALLAAAKKAGLQSGRIIDPSTGDEWDESALHRVFPT
ncbi:CTLH/CRA C-terminal to lish motif domain-containing protein [Lipomyces oligophaga]|uniref:CTLH/CRA C-terminal to lish motif domain-containing protein n=1 Tax=Lipomyces oligophaga TaxID=45792 RepID=UPI0034CD242C